MCSHIFKASSEEVIGMHSEKRMCERVFFSKLAGWHLTTSLQILTSSQIAFRDFKCLLSLTSSSGYLPLLFQMLEKHLWNSFLLYLVAKILHLLHEISSFQRCSIKEVIWKTYQNYQINRRRSSHPEVFYQKMFLKFWQNSQKKRLYWSLPFNKVAGWKP